MSADPIAGYLPIRIQFKRNDNWKLPLVEEWNKNVSQNIFLEPLHSCINALLQPTADVGLHGVKAQTSDGHTNILFFLLFHVSDISEAEPLIFLEKKGRHDVIMAHLLDSFR